MECTYTAGSQMLFFFFFYLFSSKVGFFGNNKVLSPARQSKTSRKGRKTTYSSLKWPSMSDLYRNKGMGSLYSYLNPAWTGEAGDVNTGARARPPCSCVSAAQRDSPAMRGAAADPCMEVGVCVCVLCAPDPHCVFGG